MAAYVKLGKIEGEATQKGHEKWIVVESMSAPISRSVPEGVGFERARGQTNLGDIVLVRQLDKSSVKLSEACANGTPFDEVQIDFTTMAKNKETPYLTYKLKNVIVNSYSFHGTSTGNPKPTEQVTLNFTEVEWTYFVVNPDTLQQEGQVAAKYSPKTASA